MGGAERRVVTPMSTWRARLTRASVWTYGEDWAGVPTEMLKDHRSASFRGDRSAALAAPGALESSPGCAAPGHGEGLGCPGLADALVAVAEVALARGIGWRSRPAAERRQLLVHLTALRARAGGAGARQDPP